MKDVAKYVPIHLRAAKSKVVGRCQNANIITEINTQMKPYRLIENTFRRIRFQKVVTDVRRLFLLPGIEMRCLLCDKSTSNLNIDSPIIIDIAPRIKNRVCSKVI